MTENRDEDKRTGQKRPTINKSQLKFAGEKELDESNNRPPNFRTLGGKLYLLRCYVCDPIYGLENRLPNVSTGICAWCGWSDPGNKEEGD